MCRLFDKNFAINCPHEYLLYNGFSNSDKNVALYKGIYSVGKRLLTIPEILMDEELILLIKKNL